MLDFAARSLKLDQPERYLNRELLALGFNVRVLELASDRSLPLLERVRFLAIVSANLDEFFMVRVAGLVSQLGSEDVRSQDGRTPEETLSELRDSSGRSRHRRQDRLWRDVLRPELESEGIAVDGIADVRGESAPGSSAFFDDGGVSDPYPSRGRARAAVPVHLRALALARTARRAPRRARGSARPCQVPEAIAPLREGSGEHGDCPVEEVISEFLPSLFPGRSCGIARCFGSRATPTSRSPTTPTICSKP